MSGLPETSPGQEIPEGDDARTSPDREVLRNQAAEALAQWSLRAGGWRTDSKIPPPNAEALRENSLARADAVLAVFQPVLDKLQMEGEDQRAEIARLRGGIEECVRDATIEQLALLRRAHKAEARAESAETALAEAEDLHSRKISDRDAEIAEAERQIRDVEAERDRLNATLNRVGEIGAEALEAWTPEHEYYQDRAEHKGYSHDETAAEVYGMAIKTVTAILAALDQSEETDRG